MPLSYLSVVCSGRSLTDKENGKRKMATENCATVSNGDTLLPAASFYRTRQSSDKVATRVQVYVIDAVVSVCFALCIAIN